MTTTPLSADRRSRSAVPNLTSGTPSTRRKPRAVGAAAAPWWFLVPATALYLFIVVVPNARGIQFAFTDWNGLSDEYSYVGLDNFRYFFGDSDAMAAFGHTFFLAIANTIIQNVLGLLLALGVNSRIKSRNVLRVVFFAPAVMTPIVIAYLWKNLLGTDGAVNTALEAIGLGALAQSWLGNPDLVLGSVVFVLSWQFAGYSMVIFLAGLQAIPAEVYEAGELDGAGSIRSFWSITLPLLAPAITINLMLSIIGGIKIFDQVYGLTGGGPGTSSETITSWIVKNAFFFGEFSYAIALALILTIIIAVISAVQYSMLNRFEKRAS